MSCFDERIQAKLSDVIRGPEDMHVYQGEAYEFLRDNPFSHLFIDLGLGKTVISLTLCAYLLENFLTSKILVAGPLKVMTSTWPDEIRLWRHTAPYNYTLIREDDDDPRLAAARKIDSKENQDRSWDRDMLTVKGYTEAEIRQQLGSRHETKARELIRAELARSRVSIHYIPINHLEWLVNLHGPRWPYRTVIIDEISLLKDYSTHVFKALAKVRRTEGLITRLHGLTATPAAETYEHFFTLLYLLDLGKRLGKNITTYRNNHFIANKWSRKYELREGAEQQILDKIKDVCLVMKAKDYLKLEEPTIIPRKVHLSTAQMDLYREMEKEMAITLPDGTVVEAETAAALSAKLLQMASGVLYETKMVGDWETEDMKKVKTVHRLHDEKIDMLKEMVAELQGKPVLIAYHFKSSLDALKKAFPKAVVMDPEAKCKKAWNEGKIPILLIHPKSGGHGLNLQLGGYNLIFFDLVYSYELYKQLIGRLARQGQTHPVVVQLLMACGTLDEAVWAALCLKERAQDALFSMLRRLIRNHRMNKTHASEPDEGM